MKSVIISILVFAFSYQPTTFCELNFFLQGCKIASKKSYSAGAPFNRLHFDTQSYNKIVWCKDLTIFDSTRAYVLQLQEG